MTGKQDLNWSGAKGLEGKGVGIGKAHSFEDETSSMIHEQLARLKFAEQQIMMGGKSIMDFGCGTGYNSYYIAKSQRPGSVTGIDILPECIEYCQAHFSAPEIDYLVRDCLKHDEKLGLFDVLISTEVLEHVHEQDVFLSSAMRYLKNDGLAFISTPNRATFSLSKNRSFLNNTHVKELFYDEFSNLISKHMYEYKIYSQIHTPEWHEIYINYASAANLIQSIREEIFGRSTNGTLISKVISKILYGILFKNRVSGYRDVRDRRYTDFDFIEGFDNHAMWFVAVGKPARAAPEPVPPLAT